MYIYTDLLSSVLIDQDGRTLISMYLWINNKSDMYFKYPKNKNALLLLVNFTFEAGCEAWRFWLPDFMSHDDTTVNFQLFKIPWHHKL